jgi:hypothetical protein
MKKSPHEPDADVMSAADVLDDARQIAALLRQNLLKVETVVQLPVPFSALLSALDNLGREELRVLQERIEERLSV